MATKPEDNEKKKEGKEEIASLVNGTPPKVPQKPKAPPDPNITPTDVTEVMQSAYLDYAMSVIVSRALPDIRDGLKPVQRRIVFAMQDQGYTVSGKFHKSAAVVGEVLKKYHPHGDTSVYDAMVRMAQDFSLRYPLVFPQGNFGSIDGDPPAAMRYTEAKLSKISEDLYRDINMETVGFYMNDLQNEEPKYLPAVLPNLLMNGATGIAVGMATNIPPHNLSELIDGLHCLIEKADNIGQAPKKTDKLQVTKADFSSTATVEDLTQHIKGPDFPTGGTIYDHKEIVQVYATGRGRIVTRAKMEFEEVKGGKIKLIVTEIPYMVNKSTLLAKIADLVKSKKLEGISDLRDESNRKGMRVVIELKKDVAPKKLQNQLYKYTQLQNTFNVNMVALLNNEPKTFTLKVLLEEFLKHRQQIVINRTLYLLKRAKEREHILLGLKIALDNLDAVIKLIRGSKTVETAKAGLMKTFKLSDIQAQAILDMQLRRLAALERQKIEDELKQIIETIKDHQGLVASPQRIIDTMSAELTEIKEKYGDERKTKVIKSKAGELSEEDLVAEATCIVSISKSGYIKRLKEDTYKKQGRGGKGVIGQVLKDEDEVDKIRTCNTHDYALFFTSKGKVHKMRVWEIPETTRTAKGTALINFLNIAQDESIQSFLALSAQELAKDKGFVVFSTEKGHVKRTAIKEFDNIRSSGIMAIKLSADDSLVRAGFSGGNDNVMLTTWEGQSIRFKEVAVRAMGRAAAGVTGIKLAKADDKVVGMVVIDEKGKEGDLIVVTQGGYGKKTKLKEYKVQNRAGSGILTYKATGKTGKVVYAQVQPPKSKADALIATSSGKIIRMSAKEIPQLGRNTQGVRLIRLGTSDKVTSVTFLGSTQDEKGEEIIETAE